MNLNSFSAFLIIILAFVAYAMYALNKAKNNTYVMFIKGNGDWVNRWAKPRQRRIDFDGGWYYLNPAKKISKLLDNGIYKFFPTRVDGQIFTFGNPDPLDPYSFEIAALTPEVRKALNKREDIEAYSQGNRISLQTRQKKTMIEAYMPIITLVGFAIVAYLYYTLSKKVDAVGFGQNVVQQMLQELLAR